MAEEYFPMLPKIDDKKSRIQRDQAGIWKAAINTFMSDLVTSLAEGQTISNIEKIDSIPDIWARPLLFKMALFDLNSAREFVAGLHDRVVGEWRSLLAMLALKNVKHLNLKALSINLSQDNTPLANVLKSLIPHESLDGNADAWLTDIYVIFYNDFPIAMTSPTTLLVSAADYVGTFRGQLSFPWSNDGKTLTDPINHLSRDELLDLKSWLKNLYGKVQALSRNANFVNENDTAINLLKCIELYQNDIARALGAANTDVAAKFESSKLNLHMGVSRLLDETVQGRAATINDSQVRLLVDSSRSNKKLILVSPTMARAFAQQEGIDPARLVIWSGINANNITDSDLQGEKNKIGNVNLNNTEFRRPEDFFYEQMAVVEPGNVFLGSLEISGAIVLADNDLTPILPIKRELAEIFTPQEIVKRLSISEDSDSILINFNFPLSGINGVGTDYRFTKEYPKRELIYIQQEVPVVEIWPNIRMKNWNKYYLYYENYQAQAQGESDILVDEMYYVEPWTFGKKLNEDFPAQGLKNRFTAKLDNFPEALIVNYKTANLSSAASEVGMVLLQTPKLIQRQAGFNWKIGVDFGTSSTMLYYGENNKQPTPLNFETRLFQITKSSGARAQTFVNFIASKPPERSDGSFLSIFHLLNLRDTNAVIRPLQDGHVLSFINSTIFEQLGHRVDSNLKWKDDPVGRRKVAAYVQQICMQALVEAAARGVDSIQWNFSYPTAFSQEQKLAFEATCRDGLNNAYENSGFNIDTNIDVEIWSESKASAFYFNKLNNSGTNFTNGAICIDIGAGTTDISIISGQPGRIIYHTSVQYAGRYMFKPIYDNYALFAGSDKAAGTQRNDFEERNALIDTDMRLHSEDYIKDLAFKTGQEDIKNVLQGTQFATAGLFYYLGQILNVLHAVGQYEEKTLPDVFVGGNGSRVFNWITGGVNPNDNPYLSVLEKMLADASGLEYGKKFRLNFSHYPKVEVASGMIMSKPNNADEFFDEERINFELFNEHAKDEFICNSVLAGGEFFEDDKKLDAATFISVHDMSDGISIKTLDEFTKFIKCFNDAPKLWADGIPFDDDAADELIRDVNSFFVSCKGEIEKKIFLEPVFIVELKALMEMFNYNG